LSVAEGVFLGNELGMEAAVMSAAQHAAASVESYAQRATTWMDVHIMPFWENKVLANY
jgi:hypothetical protein